MKDNALSVANFFINLAKKDGEKLRPLKLMKLVYIAYGYALALLDRSIIDYRFDKVEAWKLGPVIPSVYHSFKIYGKNPIQKETVIFTENENNIEIETPLLQDKQAQTICQFVWVRYGMGYNDSELVTILHGKGTPWGKVYEEGKNNVIPELYTKMYYKALIQRLKKKQ